MHGNLSVVYQSFTPAQNMLGSPPLDGIISLYSTPWGENAASALLVCTLWLGEINVILIGMFFTISVVVFITVLLLLDLCYVW